MKLLRGVVWTLAVVGLACWLSLGIRAQTSTEKSTTRNPAEISAQLEELQKRIDRFQTELAVAGNQFREASAAGAAASAPAAATPSPARGSLTETPTAPPGVAHSLFGTTRVTGFVDGYFGYNLNHPHSRVSDFRAFDGPANQFSLNMIQLIFDKTPDPDNSRLGYRLAFGCGEAMNVVNGSDPAGLGLSQYLKEAYFS